MNFTDRLTPGQIRKILDALELPWRQYYNSDNSGWVNMPNDYFFSDLSVNIHHGGFVDQYHAGMEETYDQETGLPIRGDIVTLVIRLKFGPDDEDKAIAWIKEVLGIDRGVRPPEMQGGFSFANDYFKPKTEVFVRLPISILKSNLNSSSKVVWCAIFNRCGPEDVYSYAGTRSIARETGLTKPTVLKAIKELERSGLIIVKPRGRDPKKPPARFPLVADTDIINKALTDGGKNDNQLKRGKETYPRVVKKFKGRGKETLPELDKGIIPSIYPEASKCEVKKFAPVLFSAFESFQYIALNPNSASCPSCLTLN